MPNENEAKIKYSRVAGTVIIGGYFVFCAIYPSAWHFIDNVDLIIHEAGHFIFIFFGQFIRILGGSLLQVLVPLIFSGYFLLNRQSFSSALVLAWAGYSLINVSVYMGDAIVQRLPLLGGESVIHDWNYLLMASHLLNYTDFLSRLTYFIGFVIITAGVAWSVSSWRPDLQHEGFLEA